MFGCFVLYRRKGIGGIDSGKTKKRRTFMAGKKVTIDANEAVSYVAYRLNEVIAIYPITRT